MPLEGRITGVTKYYCPDENLYAVELEGGELYFLVGELDYRAYTRRNLPKVFRLSIAYPTSAFTYAYRASAKIHIRATASIVVPVVAVRIEAPH